MDPLETNAQLYWTRLEESVRCCETDASLTGAVLILDVPLTAHLQPVNAPLRTQECTSWKVLDEFLSAPENADYSSRVMQVQVWIKEIALLISCQLDQPERLLVQIADNEAHAKKDYRPS